MTKPRLLLCCDMDRTVIPNGAAPEHPEARQRFKQFCQNQEVTLVYVTGRHKTLVQEAIEEFDVPEADFVISDVGTKIYQVSNTKWQELARWEQEIKQAWGGYNHAQIMAFLSKTDGLVLQEASKQNTCKLSFYADQHINQKHLLDQIQQILNQHDIAASLIWSMDEIAQTGLLDVLPANATKLHALEFLQQQLGFQLSEVVFAGDSGNDLPVLASPVPSVLVANASNAVKQEAELLATRQGNSDALYIAEPDSLAMNGNYCAGILAGVWHFQPGFRALLQNNNTSNDT
ncbi:MAG: HAD-IIB family hydrolase [Gammaproteobacteria bacterium]|nr:HAD-IIB family hydrolase [Gammaproteobacteria bacterium]